MGRKARDVSTKRGVAFHKKGNWGSSQPIFVELGHRHLEKEAVAPEVPRGSLVSFTVPLDLLRMVFPPDIVESMESVELTYKRR